MSVELLNKLDIWTIEMYILLFFTYSFAGWFMESVGGIFKVKKFVNRGFLIGPFCPVYGYGVVLITLLLGKYTNDIPVLFVLSTLICGTLEYFTSFIMEKLFNARWWDYHNRKFNINGRICLETLIPFGICGSLFLCVINPFFINLYSKIPDLARHIVVAAFLVGFIADTIVSFIIILSFKGATYKLKDNTEEISGMVKEKTEEIGDIVRDKTEDALMKAESEVIILSRKFKVRTLKLQRRVKYASNHYIGKRSIRKNISELIEKQRENIIKKINDNKEKISSELKQKKEQYEEKAKQSRNMIESSMKKRKDELESFQKNSKIIIESKIQNLKASSEEIKENFRNKSILNRRLMDAFPNVQINKIKKNKVTNKKK